MISGHKTRSVFDRYNIVNEDDLKLAAKKVQERFITILAQPGESGLEVVQGYEGAEVQIH